MRARPYREVVTIGESHRTLREVVAEEIRGMITRGELQQGERLFEDRLAEQLGRIPQPCSRSDPRPRRHRVGRGRVHGVAHTSASSIP